MPSPISPAPSTRTVRPASAAELLARPWPPRPCETEATWRPMRGLGAGPLADLERVAEQQVERGTGGTLVAGPLPRVRTWPRISVSPRTAESSPAATEAGGPRRRRRSGRRGGRRSPRAAGRPSLGEEVADVAVGAVEPLGHRVDLGAVARRQHHGLADVFAAAQVVRGPWARRASSTVIRSSRSSGTVRWFSPMTTTDTPAGAPWLRRAGRLADEVQAFPNRAHVCQSTSSVGTTPAPAARSRSSASKPMQRGRTPARAPSAKRPPQPDGHGGAAPARGDRDQQTALADAGGKGEALQLRGVVGGVDPHPGGLAVVEHRVVDRGVVGGGDDEPVAGDLARPVGPALDRDPVHRVDAPGRRRGATTCTRAPASTQPPDLAGRDRATADDEAAVGRRPPGSPGRAGGRRARPGRPVRPAARRGWRPVPGSAGRTSASAPRRCW